MKLFTATIFVLITTISAKSLRPTIRIGGQKKFQEFDCPNIGCLCTITGADGALFEFPEYYRNAAVAGELATFCPKSGDVFDLLSEQCSDADINEWFDIFDDVVDPDVAYVTADTFKNCFQCE